MKPGHRARLIESGLAPEVLDALSLVLVDTLGSGWDEAGSALYRAEDVEIPEKVIANLTYYPVREALIVVASRLDHVVSLLIGGDRPLIFIGPDCALTGTELYCGANSDLILEGHVVATRLAVLDSRNGGSIYAERDQLWAANVYIATDDMHRLEDAETGVRINHFGGRIHLGEHVWLCRDAIISGDVQIGSGSVVGARAMVRNQKVGDRVAVGGVPARILRESVTWSGEDRP